MSNSQNTSPLPLPTDRPLNGRQCEEARAAGREWAAGDRDWAATMRVMRLRYDACHWNAYARAVEEGAGAPKVAS